MPRTPNPSLAPATLAIRAGREPDRAGAPVVPAICQSTTFSQPGDRPHDGHAYSRVSNPTVSTLEAALGALEEAPPAVAFTTGMAAIAALVLASCRGADEIVVSDVAYGGTVRLCERVLRPLGIAAKFADASRVEAVDAAITPRTKLILIETPANPTLRLADVAALADLARSRGVPLAVDNTFLTPLGLRPLDLGAAASVVSTTKFVDGHGATTGGAVTSRDEELLERVRLLRKTLGSIQSPFEAWLTLQGLKTLPLRLRRHADNALHVARALESHPRLRRVTHPGLASFPQAELARRQHRDGLHGGLVSFEVDGGLEGARAFLGSLRLCTVAENLGVTETLVTHPLTMSHGDVPGEILERAGITPGLVRLSVGLEDPADVLADLEGGLA